MIRNQKRLKELNNCRFYLMAIVDESIMSSRERWRLAWLPLRLLILDTRIVNALNDRFDKRTGILEYKSRIFLLIFIA